MSKILLTTEIDWTPPPADSPKRLGEFVGGECRVQRGGLARFICTYVSNQLVAVLELREPRDYEAGDDAICG